MKWNGGERIDDFQKINSSDAIPRKPTLMILHLQVFKRGEDGEKHEENAKTPPITDECGCISNSHRQFEYGNY